MLMSRPVASLQPLPPLSAHQARGTSPETKKSLASSQGGSSRERRSPLLSSLARCSKCGTLKRNDHQCPQCALRENSKKELVAGQRSDTPDTQVPGELLHARTSTVGAPSGVQSGPPIVQYGKRKAIDSESAYDSQIDSEYHRSTCTQYQTVSALCNALGSALQRYYDICSKTPSSTSIPQLVTFKGSYSIIADPNLPNYKRIAQVSAELRKAARLPHSTFGTSVKMTDVNRTEVFACECQSRRRAPPLESTTPTPAASPTCETFGSRAAASKGKQSTVTSWIVGGKGSIWDKNRSRRAFSRMPVRSTLPSCRGKVRISVAEDNSHPFVKGQKITVTIEHHDQ